MTHVKTQVPHSYTAMCFVYNDARYDVIDNN